MYLCTWWQTLRCLTLSGNTTAVSSILVLFLTITHVTFLWTVNKKGSRSYCLDSGWVGRREGVAMALGRLLHAVFLSVGFDSCSSRPGLPFPKAWHIGTLHIRVGWWLSWCLLLTSVMFIQPLLWGHPFLCGRFLSPFFFPVCPGARLCSSLGIWKGGCLQRNVIKYTFAACPVPSVPGSTHAHPEGGELLSLPVPEPMDRAGSAGLP
jgi:hypothetical protein